MKSYILFILFMALYFPAFAQEKTEEAKKEDPSKVEKPSERPATNAQAATLAPTFTGPKLIHIASTEALQSQILDFRINHRFGNAKKTSADFLGLDNGANTELSLEYGFTNNFSAGIARISDHKTWEGRAKYLALTQSNTVPISLAFSGAIGVDTQKETMQYGPYIYPPSTGNPAWDANIKNRLNSYDLTQKDRTNYYAGVMVSRRFNDYFSLQVAPIFTHKNWAKSNTSNDRIGADIAGRIKIAKNFYFIFEGILTKKRDYKGDNYANEDQATYGIDTKTQLTPEEINSTYNTTGGLLYAYYRNVLSDKPVQHQYTPFSLGVSYETGGHVFQVFVTNMKTLAFTHILEGADYNYMKKDWTIGFNLNRYYSFEKAASEKDF